MDGKLISDAVAAARRALKELEPTEVPARLRRIAASSARWLPAPLERTLIEALDEHGWLREKALDEMPAEVVGPSRLFLERPNDWDAEIGRIAAAAAVAEEQRLIGDLTRQVEALTMQRDQARDKVKALQANLESERAAHREAIAALRDVRKPSAPQPPDQTRYVEELVERNKTLVQRLADRERRLDKTRADLLKARRAIPRSESTETEIRPADPVSLGRQLDRMMANARPDPAIGGVPVRQAGPSDGPTPGVFELPRGLTPDSAAAIGFLVDRSEPVWVIVDGYNASFHVDGVGFATPAARTRVTNGLAGLRARASGPMRITVVWDSTEDETEAPTATGIERKFVADADEEVRRLSHEATGDVVVISTDREVHAGVAPGTLVLWSEALADWLRAR
ncbi:MAG: hypothetical protein OEY98_03585 [Acidimicrobiia bacterium]|nr:hypothetical protein [Acidimicrobiia bacterium]